MILLLLGLLSIASAQFQFIGRMHQSNGKLPLMPALPSTTHYVEPTFVVNECINDTIDIKLSVITPVIVENDFDPFNTNDDELLDNCGVFFVQGHAYELNVLHNIPRENCHMFEEFTINVPLACPHFFLHGELWTDYFEVEENMIVEDTFDIYNALEDAGHTSYTIRAMATKINNTYNLDFIRSDTVPGEGTVFFCPGDCGEEDPTDCHVGADICPDVEPTTGPQLNNIGGQISLSDLLEGRRTSEALDYCACCNQRVYDFPLLLKSRAVFGDTVLNMIKEVWSHPSVNSGMDSTPVWNPSTQCENFNGIYNPNRAIGVPHVMQVDSNNFWDECGTCPVPIMIIHKTSMGEECHPPLEQSLIDPGICLTPDTLVYGDISGSKMKMCVNCQVVNGDITNNCFYPE